MNKATWAILNAWSGMDKSEAHMDIAARAFDYAEAKLHGKASGPGDPHYYDWQIVYWGRIIEIARDEQPDQHVRLIGFAERMLAHNVERKLESA